MAWDDAKRAQAVELYLEGEPTPENSAELLKEIAETLDETPNGVRAILSKAEVYVKKTPETKKASTGGSTGGGRVSKAEQHQALKDAISATGQEPDEGIIEKLSGKAAAYFAGVITGINE